MSERERHVVIVGCGRVGSGLAHRLADIGHTVAVVDKRAEAFRRLVPGRGIEQVVGVGFDPHALEAAGVERASAVAAVTSGDNSNIVVARVARERFGVPRVLARIYDSRRAAIYERLGIPTVATVAWTIEQAVSRLTPTDATVGWYDPSARVALVERTVPAHWAGHPVADLELDGTARIVAVSRLGAGSVPAPGLIAQDGDVVHVAVAVDHLDELDRHLDVPPGGHR